MYNKTFLLQKQIYIYYSIIILLAAEANIIRFIYIYLNISEFCNKTSCCRSKSKYSKYGLLLLLQKQ